MLHELLGGTLRKDSKEHFVYVVSIANYIAMFYYSLFNV